MVNTYSAETECLTLTLLIIVLVDRIIKLNSFPYPW